MKKTVKIDLREKSATDLRKLLETKKKELLESKVKHHLGQVKDISIFTKLRTEISYIKFLVANHKN